MRENSNEYNEHAKLLPEVPADFELWEALQAMETATGQIIQEVPELNNFHTRAAIETIGPALVEEAQLNRTFFHSKTETLLFAGLAQWIGEAQAQAKLSPEHYIGVQNALALLTHVDDLKKKEAAYNRVTNPEATLQLQRSDKVKSAIAEVAERMNIDSYNESPYNLRVLNVDPDDLEDYETATLLRTIDQPDLGTAWTEIGRNVNTIYIPLCIAEAIEYTPHLRAQELLKRALQHEYVHTQSPLTLAHDHLGSPFEERRADLFSFSDMQEESYTELADFFARIQDINGVCVDDLLRRNLSKDDFYPEIARQLGVQNTLAVTFASPIGETGGSSLLERVARQFGGLEGVIQRLET